MFVGGLRLSYPDGSHANMEASLCPDGSHVIVNTEDADGDVTSLELMTAAQTEYAGLVHLIAACRVRAMTVDADDLPGLGERMQQLAAALDELAAEIREAE